MNRFGGTMKLSGGMVTVITTVLMSLVISAPGSAQTITVQDSIKAAQLAEVDGPTSGKEKDESRTAQPQQNLEDQPFRIPRPVSTEPFDYSKLDPHHYDLEAVRVTESIKLDGKLNEDIWQLATPAGNFYQLEPAEGAPASQPTEVRVLYDDKNLYIGFMCYDARPDGLMAPDMQRDARLSFSNDMVYVVIAPLEGGREAYEFQTNPNGARADAFVSKEGNNSDRDWNGYWNAASTRNEYGWSTEFVIPFDVLRFPSQPSQSWSVNFGRRIQRNREESYWVPLSRQDGQQALYRFQKGGRLVGLQNIKPGGKFQILPFSVMGAEGTRFNTIAPSQALPIAGTGFSNAFQRQFGGDFKWSVTSGLTYNATINPDFAQVEADDQIVNLSRFEFQFNEKRPFFLERSDIFSLTGGGRRGGGGGSGGSDPTPQIFFSRRVGRQLPDGSSAPIDLGMRMTGKVGKTTIGYINVQTRETQYEEEGVTRTEPLTNWQALRLSQDIGARSSVGLLATFREPDPGLHKDFGTPVPRFSNRDFNRVLGFDGNLAFQRSQHQVSVLLAKSWTDTLSASNDEITWRIMERWQNRWLSYGVSYMEIGKDFIAQSGYVQQTNIRRAGLGLNFSPFIRKFGVRRIEASLRTNYLSSRDASFSDPETWQVNPSIFWELENGIGIWTGWTRNFDTLNGVVNSDIAGVHFANGSYTYDQGSLFLFTNRGKPISAEGNFRFGKFYGANLLSASGELSIKPSPRFAFEPGISWTRLERPDRAGLLPNEFDYRTRVIPRARVNYSFTPNLSLTSFLQLNTDKQRTQDNLHLNTVTMNILLAYRSPYGHTFFLAFNQFHDDSLDTDGSFDPFSRTPLRLRDQQFVAKISYLLSL